MSKVKLKALDTADLEVMAVHLQDAILRVGDLAFLKKQRRFAAVGTRFCWEYVDIASGKPKKGKSYYRARTGFHFDTVGAVKARGFDQSDSEAFLVLLETGFEEGEDGSGKVRLSFAGGAEIVLDVECLEASLSDLTAPWPTDQMPSHESE